jgi:hypothetical protein
MQEKRLTRKKHKKFDLVRFTVEMEQLAMKIVSICWIIKITFYLDIYGG